MQPLPSDNSISNDCEMKSSEFVVLKPHADPVVTAPDDAIDNTYTVDEEEDGTLTFRKISQRENRNRIITIKTKVRRTSSNANEEVRDTTVETNFLTPKGTVIQERDVVQSKKKVTPRGSHYYQRSTLHTRRVQDKEGGDQLQHDVCMETDNTSVSQGDSWGNRIVTRIALDSSTGPLPTATLEELDSFSQLEGPEKSHISVLGKMDLSKTSNGYSNVSESEEDDKEEKISKTKCEHVLRKSNCLSSPTKKHSYSVHLQC